MKCKCVTAPLPGLANAGLLSDIPSSKTNTCLLNDLPVKSGISTSSIDRYDSRSFIDRDRVAKGATTTRDHTE